MSKCIPINDENARERCLEALLRERIIQRTENAGGFSVHSSLSEIYGLRKKIYIALVPQTLLYGRSRIVINWYLDMPLSNRNWGWYTRPTKKNIKRLFEQIHITGSNDVHYPAGEIYKSTVPEWTLGGHNKVCEKTELIHALIQHYVRTKQNHKYVYKRLQGMLEEDIHADVMQHHSKDLLFFVTLEEL